MNFQSQLKSVQFNTSNRDRDESQYYPNNLTSTKLPTLQKSIKNLKSHSVKSTQSLNTQFDMNKYIKLKDSAIRQTLLGCSEEEEDKKQVNELVNQQMQKQEKEERHDKYQNLKYQISTIISNKKSNKKKRKGNNQYFPILQKKAKQFKNQLIKNQTMDAEVDSKEQNVNYQKINSVILKYQQKNRLSNFKQFGQRYANQFQQLQSFINSKEIMQNLSSDLKNYTIFLNKKANTFQDKLEKFKQAQQVKAYNLQQKMKKRRIFTEKEKKQKENEQEQIFTEKLVSRIIHHLETSEHMDKKSMKNKKKSQKYELHEANYMTKKNIQLLKQEQRSASDNNDWFDSYLQSKIQEQQKKSYKEFQFENHLNFINKLQNSVQKFIEDEKFRKQQEVSSNTMKIFEQKSNDIIKLIIQNSKAIYKKNFIKQPEFKQMDSRQIKDSIFKAVQKIEQNHKDHRRNAIINPQHITLLANGSNEQQKAQKRSLQNKKSLFYEIQQQKKDSVDVQQRNSKFVNLIKQINTCESLQSHTTKNIHHSHVNSDFNVQRSETQQSSIFVT